MNLKVMVLAGVLLTFLIFNLFPRKPESINQAGTEIAPSPLPFMEYTIPYLKSRNYSSQLGDQIPVATKSGYTSYLTSYTSDGLSINALLTRPTGNQPSSGWQAIVFVHGYIPPASYRTQERYVDYVDAFAGNGFVVFKIDLRGHGESEGEPGGAYYSSDYVIDTLNAYAALESTDFVDKNSIGLWGHSMSGNVVLRSIAAKPDVPAAVIWAGAGFTYQDLLDYRLSDGSYRPPANETKRQRLRRELFNTYGEFNSDSQFWKQMVPTNYIDQFTGALELHHAIDDDVVSINYSRNLSQILNTKNIRHKFYEYPTGGHNISGASFQNAMRSIDFFKTNL